MTPLALGIFTPPVLERVMETHRSQCLSGSVGALWGVLFSFCFVSLVFFRGREGEGEPVCYIVVFDCTCLDSAFIQRRRAGGLPKNDESPRKHVPVIQPGVYESGVHLQGNRSFDLLVPLGSS